MEMLLTGEFIDAATALAWGLVNRVVAAADLDQAVKAFTDIIVARSPEIIAMGKQAFYRQIEAPMAQAYTLSCEAMARNLVHPHAAEGIDAFLGKRAPQWNGG